MNLSRRLLSWCRPYWRWMLLALGLIVFTSLAINFLPVLLQQITDRVLLDPTPPAAERIELLTKIGILYLSVSLIGQLVRYAQGLLTAWIGQRIIQDLRMAVFRKVLRMHQGFFDQTAVGTLMTRVTSDIERLQHFVTEGVVGSIADLFMILCILGYMIWFSPVLSLSVLVPMPFLFAAMYYVNTRLRNANRNIRDRQSRLNALTQEYLTGMTTIQLFNREAASRQEFDDRNRHLRGAHYDEVRWFSLYFPIIEIGQAIAILATLLIGGITLMQGDSDTITIGKLVAFLAYVRNYFQPLGSLSDKAGSFQIALASTERIFTLLDAEEKIVDPPKPASPDLISGSISFENVWFAYNPENWVIKDLSFTVEPGQILAVVGATGAGKSTIINLVSRFYDIQKGKITIGGTDIRDLETTELRRRIGCVFQDPFIFTASVAENIGLNNPAVARTTIEQAARTVNAHLFIQELPQGYDTILNERGEGLSLGQKQLLAMARALAQNPALLFVLDEATASIDTASEMLIQDALEKLMSERTSIVIAHRLSTIRHADHILVMRHGELVDQGTHDELMARDGYYRQLYDLLLHAPSHGNEDDSN